MELPFEQSALDEFEAAAKYINDERARDIRRFGLERFAYSIVLGVVAGRRAVVAVAHMSREPGYWTGRLV